MSIGLSFVLELAVVGAADDLRDLSRTLVECKGAMEGVRGNKLCARWGTAKAIWVGRLAAGIVSLLGEQKD